MAELELEKRIGTSPPNRVVLDTASAADDMQDLLRSYDVRGYAALEHLLFKADDLSAVARRCAHLRDIANEIADLTAESRDAWFDDFEQRFLAAGDGDPFLLPGDALSLPFAEALNVTERMLRDRIGHPSGLFDGEVKPDAFEAPISGTSLQGLRATLEGLQSLMVGDGENGVSSLIATRDGVLSTKDPKLAAAVTRRLQKLVDALDADGSGAAETIADSPKQLKRLYHQTERLQEQLIEATLVLELNVL